MFRLKAIQPKHIVILICVLAFIAYSYPALTAPRASISPDEVVNSYFAEVYAKTGELKYQSAFANIDPFFFRPRGTVVVDDQYVAPGKFLGYPIIVGTIGRFISMDVSVFVIPFFSAISVYYFFLFVRREFDQKIALISSSVMVIASSYWYWSTMYWYEDALAIFFLLGGLNYLFRGIEEPSFRSLCLSSLMFGTTVIIKPYYAVVLLPFLAVVLLSKKVDLKHALLSATPFLFLTFVFLLANHYTYGSWFVTGFHLTYDIGQDLIPSSKQYEIAIAASNYTDYFLFIFPASLFGILGIINYTSIFRKTRKRLPLFFIIVAIVLTGYVLVLSGTSNLTNVHHSAIRYLIFVHLLLVPFAAYFVLSIGRIRPFIAVILCVALILPNIAIVTSSEQIVSSRTRYASYTSYIDARIDRNSVIICQYVDKIYFPSMLTGNPAFLRSDNRESLCANITEELLQNGISVYLVMDIWGNASAIDYAVYEDYLNARGLILEPFLPSMGFFRVVPE